MTKDLIELTKTQLKAIIPAFFYLLSVISLIILLQPQGFQTVVPMLVILNIIRSLHDIFNFKAFIKNVITSSIVISILYLIMFESLKYGLIGFVLYIVTLSFYVMWGSKNKRTSFLQGLRNIETAMFGKPLDKENWADEKPSVNIKLRNK